MTLDERAFYIRQSIDGTQRIIDECMKRYKDGSMDALKIALDGHVQLAEIFKKVQELSSYGHSYDYGR
ncbi:MAG TPA: hypothetical protein VFI73_03355 [Candidatus Nitrosopolaris sp.]|nr:hypothetical protein [Candidatus Nitrosopolaris sp.]